jgi:CheY-like chemotaxis protein
VSRTVIPLSTRLLQRHDAVKHIESIVLANGADPSLMGLEVSADLFALDVKHMVRSLTELKAIGFELTLSHLDAGLVSISLLRQLPFDVIKIDRSCVGDIVADPQSVSLTRMVIGMAHGLQMQVLADGVQTEEQLAQLVAHKCDRLQGAIFSAPLNAPELAKLVNDGHHLSPESIGIKLASRTLLLVDDEGSILASLRRLLRVDGYRILEAGSGEEGLRLLAENQVSVIMSDQRMPNMTGVEFLRQAKRLYPETIRIVLSGYTELQSITDAINEGAIYKFLTKPWDDDLLREQVAEAFRHKDMADENLRLSLRISEANHELAEVNRRLRSVLDAQQAQIQRHQTRLEVAGVVLACIPIPVVGIDVDGMVAFVNNRADEVIAPAGTLLGNMVDDVLPEALRVPASASVHTVIFDQVPYQVLCNAMATDKGSLGMVLTLLPMAPGVGQANKQSQAEES